MVHHSGLPGAAVNFAAVFALLLLGLVKNRFAAEKLLFVCGGRIRLLHYSVRSASIDVAVTLFFS